MMVRFITANNETISTPATEDLAFSVNYGNGPGW